MSEELATLTHQKPSGEHPIPDFCPADFGGIDDAAKADSKRIMSHLR